MTHYRAYAVRFDGNFDGYQSLNCADDDDAIGKARRLADSSAIELWSGERFVTRLEHRSKLGEHEFTGYFLTYMRRLRHDRMLSYAR